MRRREVVSLERRDMVNLNRRTVVNFTGASGPDLPQTLAGRSVVVTGTLEQWSREAAEEAVKARGGKAPSSVSGRTDWVVAGEGPGSAKLSRAQELGVPVIDETSFGRLLETGSP